MRKGNKSTERGRLVIVSMKVYIPHSKPPGFKIKVNKTREGFGY